VAGNYAHGSWMTRRMRLNESLVLFHTGYGVSHLSLEESRLYLPHGLDIHVR
jgi:hypothetical protein